jgi:drug/metabolite transporter (DMT)-like permease
VEGLPQGYLPYVAVVLVALCNITGNIMLKLGAGGSSVLLLGLAGWQSIAGVMLFGSGIVLYAWALRFIPLHVAQIIASLQYAGVIVAASIVLGEAITTMRWIGITFIAVGILVCMRQ